MRQVNGQVSCDNRQSCMFIIDTPIFKKDLKLIKSLFFIALRVLSRKATDDRLYDNNKLATQFILPSFLSFLTSKETPVLFY